VADEAPRLPSRNGGPTFKGEGVGGRGGLLLRKRGKRRLEGQEREGERREGEGRMEALFISG